MEMLDGDIGWEAVGRGHWIEMDGDVGRACWMGLWTGMLDGGTGDGDHEQGSTGWEKHCKEMDRGVGCGGTGWRTVGWRHWTGKLDRVLWRETLDQDVGRRDALIGSWAVTLEGEVLEMLDGDAGDAGWGDAGW